MAHPQHTHMQPLSRPMARKSGPLPSEKFGALVGTIDHLTLSAHDGSKADDNHVYIWLKVNSGPLSGRYECAFNTESNQGSDVQYYVHEEDINPGQFPSVGFWPAQVSYHELGLNQAEFTPIVNGTLRSLVYHYAELCDMVAAYGITYKEGNGLHDIHMNNGNADPTHPNLEQQDGVLQFYFRRETASSRRVWIFIKFDNQTL